MLRDRGQDPIASLLIVLGIVAAVTLTLLTKHIFWFFAAYMPALFYLGLKLVLLSRRKQQ